MKNLWLCVSLTLFASLIALSQGHAKGVITGGGGGAFVCRDSQNVIKTAQLVDLFEAEATGLAIAYDNATPIADQIEKAIAKLAAVFPAFAQGTELAWKTVQAHEAGGPNVIIDPPTDVDKHYSKAGCPLEGMMYFDDARNVLVENTQIFNAQVTKTDFAASYLHESIYKVMRDHSLPAANNSVLTRIIVGCLLAQKDVGECLGLVKTLQPSGNDVWSCEVKGPNSSVLSFYMYAFSNEELSWKLEITRLGDYSPQYATVAKVSQSIVDIPVGTPPPPKLGDYTFNHASIVGLEGLGNPLPRNAIPDFSVVRVNPLTLRFSSGGLKNAICKRVSLK